jgi:broad specificity phosphatase PhoE
MKLLKNIYMTRHGATDYNDRDIVQGWMDNRLSERGKTEAGKLAERLKKVNIDIIYHSPLSRTQETAEIVNRHHNAPLKAIDCFIEMNLGDWEGISFHKLKEENPLVHEEWVANVDSQVPGGETFREVFARVKPGVDEILDSPHQDILIAGHAMVNRGILGHLMDFDLLHARRFKLENCSYSKLMVFQLTRGRHVLIETWNDLTHLTK